MSLGDPFYFAAQRAHTPAGTSTTFEGNHFLKIASGFANNTCVPKLKVACVSLRNCKLQMHKSKPIRLTSTLALILPRSVNVTKIFPVVPVKKVELLLILLSSPPLLVNLLQNCKYLSNSSTSLS